MGQRLAPQMMPVEEVLECTICLDVPASPIHNCSNGHIICGICAEKVQKCGLCESEPLEVSVLAERLSRRMEFKSKCPNYYDGCRNLIASTGLKDHIPECYYRPVICTEQFGERCNKVEIPFKDYPLHLQEKHEYTQLTTFSRHVTTVNNKLPANAKWPLEMATKDGKFFLLHSYIGKDAIRFVMTILADEEEAGKYLYELNLEKELDGKQIKCSWTLPVVPYVQEPMFDVTIPKACLLDFYTNKEKVSNNRIKYTFKMSHRII